MNRPLAALILLFHLFLPATGQTEEAPSSTIDEMKIAELTKMHEQAEKMIAVNQYREALKLYTDIVLLEPDDETAYTAMGNIYMVLSDTTRAEDAYKNALHINPQNEIARFGLRKIADPDYTPPDFEEKEVVSTTPVPPPAENKPAFEERDAKDIQLALKNAGLYWDEIDGILGPASKAAITTFQKQHGLEPDGVVGSKTWAELKDYLRTTSEVT